MNAQLFALSPAGDVRWKAPIAYNPPAFGKLAAAPEGPYVEVAVPAAGGSAASSVEVDGFDAATGMRRTVASNQYLLGAAHGGGVFIADHQGSPSITLHQLDAAGNPVWSHVLTAADAQTGVRLDGAVATSDGGAVAFGPSDGKVDAESSFVTAFDATGATRWAFAAPFRVDHAVPIQQDQMLLAGRPPSPVHDTDVTLAVAIPAGITRTLSFTGPGLQSVSGLAVTPDGLAWLQIASFEDPDIQAAVIHVGALTFAGPGMYLFKLAP